MNGKIYFLLVRIKLKHMEVEIRRRETTGGQAFASRQAPEPSGPAGAQVVVAADNPLCGGRRAAVQHRSLLTAAEAQFLRCLTVALLLWLL